MEHRLSTVLVVKGVKTRFLRNNHFYGEFPSCLFEHCLHRIDISNNSFYGHINTNFRNMVPTDNGLLNIASNYFYGDPSLYANGCVFCPNGVIPPDVLEDPYGDSGSGGQCGGSSTLVGFRKQGRASVRLNCFALNDQAGCTANETQRGDEACLSFCSMSREQGPCDGHGACVPVQAGAADGGFTCECEEGFVTVNGTFGSTCARPSPPLSVVLHWPKTPPHTPFLPAVSTPTSSGLSTGAVVGIAIGSAAAFALLLALVVALLWPKQRKKWRDLDVCQEFSISEILQATDNWSSDNVLGKGGFATVYKGVSRRGELLAVKRVELMSNEFENEVRAMASLRHDNVVRLLGFCLHQSTESGRQEQILVYEFMANGDLQHQLHGNRSSLSLHQRMKMAQGAAEGVAYLHSFTPPIVHRDLKPGNILIGDNFQAKIADFGLLKKLTHADDGGDTTRVAGTPGYVDPDYNRTHVVTEKSDVYSFGVVLLQLLTGHAPQVEGTNRVICGWASSKVQAYEFASLKDPKLDAPEEAVVELADIALDCVKVPGCRRPDMKDVARRLHAILTKYCADGPSSSSADPAVHVEEERPSFGGGISMETFERSELSEGPSEWPTSRILSSSLSSKWWSFQQVGL
ncbi:unnamed protein product [Closterium sp. Yama58-4]|nr:unnamed protein product [Closterium sp. Yama58-4]